MSFVDIWATISSIAVISVFAIALLAVLFVIGVFVVLDLLERCSKKRVRQDPVFGSIEFFFGSWMTPDSSVLIEADDKGPTEEQRLLYKSLNDALPKYIEAGKSYLGEKMPDLDFSAHEKNRMVIGNDVLKREFSLEFSSEDSAFVYRVDFADDKPVSCDKYQV